jgi:heavy metal sensor kinase
MILTVRQITAENLQLRLSLPDTKDEIKQLAETFNDMLEKINRSFVSQKQFIQDVSHELRTPLTVLKGELEVALKRDRSADAYRFILQSNLEEIDKIHRILEDLLVLARLDSEDTTLKKKPADIVQFIRDIVGDVEILTQQKGITISLHAGESVILDFDRERMRRVFFNILDNAIKFTPEHGNITLTLAKENHIIVIRVSDTGVGIPQEDLPFIFDRFYRADKSRSSEGFGLGLSITKSIIQAHKGAIACNSEPGRGTTFTISLPFGDLEGHS